MSFLDWLSGHNEEEDWQRRAREDAHDIEGMAFDDPYADDFPDFKFDTDGEQPAIHLDDDHSGPDPRTDWSFWERFFGI